MLIQENSWEKLRLTQEDTKPADKKRKESNER